MSFASLTTILITIIVPIAVFLFYGFLRLRTVRNGIKILEQAGLNVMPEHSILFGHGAYIDKVSKTFPPGASIDYAVAKIAHEYESGAVYMDVWPFSEPILVLTTPTAANQLQEYTDLPKPITVGKQFDVFTAGKSMFTMKKEHWKPWRSMYNPSFSASHVLQLAPVVVEECKVFCDILRKRVQDGGVFGLEKLTASLSLDIIGRTTLDMKLCHQQQEHPLAWTLRRQTKWLAISKIVPPWHQLNPVRHFILWDNNRRMRNIIGNELEKRFSEAKETSTKKNGFGKSIMSLTLKSYLKETLGATNLPLDKHFKATTISNIIFFVLAGHETTSSTICFCYHNLFTHSDALAHIRAEHDAVFGKDTMIEHIESIIKKEPERLNQLPYTVAVIKETLRLYPPVAMIRVGNSSLNLADDFGNVLPTAGYMPWIVHVGIHRNPKYWKDPHCFIPERWLVKEGDSLYPVKGAWRPFERGPRNCIGQSLAMMELRIVLLMTIRQFDITPTYSASDPEIYGSKAWVSEGEGLGGKPCKGYPVRVSLAERST